MFQNQRKIGFCFIQILHCKVAWLAQSSIFSVLTAVNVRDYAPGGSAPKMKICKATLLVCITHPNFLGKSSIGIAFLWWTGSGQKQRGSAGR